MLIIRFIESSTSVSLCMVSQVERENHAVTKMYSFATFCLKAESELSALQSYMLCYAIYLHLSSQTWGKLFHTTVIVIYTYVAWAL